MTLDHHSSYLPVLNSPELVTIIGRGWGFPVGVSSTGGIGVAEGIDDIEQAIIMILSTPKHTRVLRPEFGCRIHELLFDPITMVTSVKAAYYVREALHWWEPRIEVLNVFADLDAAVDGRMLITIDYSIRTTHEHRSLIYPFYTIPGEE